MSLLDTASLIVTPNGYKEGKLYSVIPSDGSGDLSVTRATTATRVNSAGLVELVPYNLFTYSEQFDSADWSKSSGTITANSTTAPNGTTTADTFTGNGALSNHDFFEGFTGGANTTASIYVKKNTAQYVYISLNYQSSGVNWATGVYDLDNLTTATFQSGGVTNQVATITDEGNGWRRITLSVDTANTSLYCMFGLSDSMSPTLGSRGRVENSSSQSFYAWGAQIVEGSTAKDYQKTETRLNIPRLDYSNGTCPSLLVEPQRTNLALYSSSFDSAFWDKINVSITANATTSPSGVQDADMTTNSTLVGDRYQQLIFTPSSGFRTISIYAKAGTASIVGLQTYDNVSDAQAYFDLSNGTITSTSGGVTATITDVGDGWYRLTHTYNSPTNVVYFQIQLGSQAGTRYFWGAQLEAGNYSTSYIPTTSASVTRNADVISKTGISSLIGQTEGTLFWEGIGTTQSTGNDLWMFGTFVDDTSVAVLLYYVHSSGYVNCYINNGSSFVNLGAPLNITNNNKIAVGYKNGDFAMYANGTLLDSNTSATAIPSGMNQVAMNKWQGNSGVQKQQMKAAALWKTRLTNTQLATLTTL